MDSSKEMKNRERIAKQIAKTSDSNRKKYRALKFDKIKKDAGETFSAYRRISETNCEKHRWQGISAD